VTMAASPSAIAMMISRRASQALDGAPERGVMCCSICECRRAMRVFYQRARLAPGRYAA
jgi:hypothetical protein